jgi:peptide subunit release factor 1 (eRF1)
MTTVKAFVGNGGIESGARIAARSAKHIIERLQQLDAHGEQVLTVYLNVDSRLPAGRHPEVQLTGLLAPLAGNGPSYHRLAEEEQRVRRALPDAQQDAQGLAIFTCSPAGLFLVARLPVAVQPAAYWDTRAHLRPLLALIDEYEKSVIVLADKQYARFFRVYLEQIEEIDDIWDHVPPHQAQGAEAQSNIARHHEERVKWHLRRVCNLLGQIADEERVDRIVLGGPVEALAQLEHLLAPRLRRRLAGTMHCSLFATVDEISTRAHTVLEQAERKNEAECVRQVLEARGRQQAALGLQEVGPAVSAGQVLLLVADAAARPAGFICSQCELIAPDGAAVCPACSGSLQNVPDLVEHMAERVLQQGGRFEEVRGAAAESLVSAQGMAALLRYRLPQASAV